MPTPIPFNRKAKPAAEQDLAKKESIRERIERFVTNKLSMTPDEDGNVTMPFEDIPAIQEIVIWPGVALMIDINHIGKPGTDIRYGASPAPLMVAGKVMLGLDGKPKIDPNKITIHLERVEPNTLIVPQ